MTCSSQIPHPRRVIKGSERENLPPMVTMTPGGGQDAGVARWCKRFCWFPNEVLGGLVIAVSLFNETLPCCESILYILDRDEWWSGLCGTNQYRRWWIDSFRGFLMTTSLETTTRKRRHSFQGGDIGGGGREEPLDRHSLADRLQQDFIYVSTIHKKEDCIHGLPNRCTIILVYSFSHKITAWYYVERGSG